MELATYISFSISPILIIVGFLILHYSFKLKHMSALWYAVILGMISVVLIVLSNYVIDSQWHGNYRSLRRLLFYVIIVIAISAELGKYLVLRLNFYKRKDFEGPIEGIIYAIFIGLGFSTVAIVLFAYQMIGNPMVNYQEIFLYTYPFANIVTAICMGFFIGMGKLRKNFLIDDATGLFVAVFFHGLYYFSLRSQDPILIGIVVIGFVIISITLLVRAINLRKEKEN